MLKLLITTVLVATVLCNIDQKADLKLTLNRQKLKELTGEHLYDSEFELDNYKITSLEADTFTDVRKTLVDLDLSYNELVSLPENVFQGLTKIEKINLGNNKFIQINPYLFSGLTTLLEIKLKKMDLTSIAPNTFKGLKNLHTLDLGMNYITTLDKSLLDDLTNLEELELRYNRIEDLPVGFFAKTRKLKELSLNHNQLMVLNAYPSQCLERFNIEDNKNPKIDTRMIKMCSGSDKSGSGSGSGVNGAVALNAASGALVGLSAIVLIKQYF